MKTPERDVSRSRRAYALLLVAYPREFRREYGREMALVFADRCRERSRAASLARLWGEALLDLALTAPREHLERFREGGGVMRTLRTVALALVVYAFTLLVVAPLYARNIVNLPVFVNGLIDALISTGLIFNFVFLLLTLTRWLEGVRAVRAALAVTTLIVGGLIALIAASSGPHGRLNLLIVVAQVLSLLVWFALHLWWVLRKGRHIPPAAAA
ncbi:MAG TPA: hypothetical protein VJ866_15875 [Pyrinomonadaceae bacterium]|nr:hypothetical protein [Pyrinomonadaceae bacterium]